jgi:hypothetical protein
MRLLEGSVLFQDLVHPDETKMPTRCATNEPLKGNGDYTSDAEPPGSASLKGDYKGDEGDAPSTAPPKGDDDVDDDDGVLNGDNPPVIKLLKPDMTRPKAGKVGERGDTPGPALLAVGKAPRAHMRTCRARPRERERVRRPDQSHLGRNHTLGAITPWARPNTPRAR